MLAPSRARAGFPFAILLAACTVALIAACGNHSHTTGSSTGQGGGAMNTGASTGQGFSSGTQMSDTLTISPPSATITIGTKGVAATQAFTALLNGSPLTSQVSWTLDSYAEGSISGNGTYTTTGLVGGVATVTAAYGG